jgi:hypothetical protein
VSTASHGGIFLSDERLKQLPSVLASAPTFTQDPNWFEEDIDAILPVLAFPEHFSGQSCWNAIRGADYNSGSETPYKLAACCKAFLTLPESLPVRTKAGAWAAAEGLADKWESCGCSCGGSSPGWSVSFRRGEDQRNETLREYPSRQFWTEAEIKKASLCN